MLYNATFQVDSWTFAAWVFSLYSIRYGSSFPPNVRSASSSFFKFRSQCPTFWTHVFLAGDYVSFTSFSNTRDNPHIIFFFFGIIQIIYTLHRNFLFFLIICRLFTVIHSQYVYINLYSIQNKEWLYVCLVYHS